MPLLHFPVRHPETGEPIDNFETVAPRILKLFRDRGMSDEQLRYHAFRIDVPDEEIEAAFENARRTIQAARADLARLQQEEPAGEG